MSQRANPYLQYFSNQAGSGLSHFSGTRFQRGNGIGSFFAKIFRSIILPGLKSTGKFVGKQALSAGVDLAKDVLAGNKIKESAKMRGKQFGNTLLDAAEKRVQSGGRRRKKRQYKSRRVHPNSLRALRAIHARRKASKRTSKKARRRTRKKGRRLKASSLSKLLSKHLK